jgi:ABC-type nitrate/sulfonate/bicarbonate transport system substrate-binding protein
MGERVGWGRRAVMVIAAALVLIALACAPATRPVPGPEGRHVGQAPRAAGAPAGAPSSAPGGGSMGARLAEPATVRVAYSSLWGANVVPWTAFEAGIFAKHMIDAELTFISSAQTVPAALAGEVEVSFGGGYAVMASRLGGGDLSIFFNVTNWSPYELMVTPDIGSGADLRGKTLGVSRFGSASDVATRVALRKLGLVPERDVVLIQTSGLTERIAAMRAGALAGGVAVPPDNLVLRREGFKTLIDLGATGEPELTNTAFATTRWLNEHQEIAQAFTDALVEAIYYVKTHRDVTERVLGKYLQLDDPDLLAETYSHFVEQHLERLPDIGQEAGRQYLASLVETDPRAATAQVSEFFDLRFIERARASGMVERLWAGQ